ncbi:MAG: putative Ig domain-containing protein, partial [Bryobacteraceae bacterium]
YNVLVQDGYSPKHEISFTPLDYRLNMGFISQSLGLAGFQQWKVDQWTSDPWNSLPVYGGVYSDGLLVYPGRQAGLTGYAPSMRLKWTRDGVDDFEYVEILKKLGDSEWALWQARSVGPDWRNWTRDTTQVEAVRLALGNRIEWLVSGQASNIPVVNSQGAVQATAGTALSYQVAASNNPVSFDAVGLPAGIAIDRSSGLISGTPAFAGNTQVLIRATNAAGSGSAILDLKVDPPASPIALVQSNSVEGSAVQSVSAAFQTGNTGGNLVIAFVRMSTTTQTVTVSDTAGNSYSEAIAQAQDADGHQVHIFYARKIARGPNRVTAAFSSANNHPWLAIYEYRGLNTTDPLDQTAAAQGSGATPATGAAALAATAGELVFTGTGLPASFTGSVVNTGYYTLTQQDTGSARAANAGALAFSIAPYTGKFTLNTSADWTAVLATFKP